MQCPSQWAMEGGRQGGGGGGSRLPNDDLPASAPCSSGLQSTFLPPVSSGTTSSKMASDLLTADSAWSPVLCGSVHLLSPLCCQEVVKTCGAAGGPPSHNNVSISCL